MVNVTLDDEATTTPPEENSLVAAPDSLIGCQEAPSDSMAVLFSTSLPSTSDQLSTIYAVDLAKLEAGQSYYLIPKSWWRSWYSYVTSKGDASPVAPPGPIKLTEVLKALASQNRKALESLEPFPLVVVSVKVWEFLKDW